MNQSNPWQSLISNNRIPRSTAAVELMREAFVWALTERERWRIARDSAGSEDRIKLARKHIATYDGIIAQIESWLSAR